MNAEQLARMIGELARAVLGRTEIDAADDFFELGASSLTIVDLQIQLERRLGCAVPTQLLMRAPSIDGWVSAYRSAVPAAHAAEAAVRAEPAA